MPNSESSLKDRVYNTKFTAHSTKSFLRVSKYQTSVECKTWTHCKAERVGTKVEKWKVCCKDEESVEFPFCGPWGTATYCRLNSAFASFRHLDVLLVLCKRPPQHWEPLQQQEEPNVQGICSFPSLPFSQNAKSCKKPNHSVAAWWMLHERLLDAASIHRSYFESLPIQYFYWWLINIQDIYIYIHINIPTIYQLYYQLYYQFYHIVPYCTSRVHTCSLRCSCRAPLISQSPPFPDPRDPTCTKPLERLPGGRGKRQRQRNTGVRQIWSFFSFSEFLRVRLEFQIWKKQLEFLQIQQLGWRLTGSFLE